MFTKQKTKKQKHDSGHIKIERKHLAFDFKRDRKDMNGTETHQDRFHRFKSIVVCLLFA